MNKQKRKRLGEAFDLISQAEEILEEVKEEEEDSYENLPDGFRYGEKGEEMQSYIEMMDEAIEYVQNANSVIEQI